jgi:hypothetical protein
MELERWHHYSSIGTFVGTVVIIILAVVPMLPLSNTNGKAEKAPAPEQRVDVSVTGWIPASVLGLGIIGSAVLNFAATRKRRRVIRSDSAPGRPLEIISAHWGPPDDPNRSDVTEIVRRRVAGDSVEVPVTIRSLGDPANGVGKFLTVVYSLTRTIRVPEWPARNLILPEPPPAPLTIISARWGIGGSAYTDVTDIVRAHAGPDSIDIPASIGLLGDPYQGTPKRLVVAYSFARRWEVTINESENLVLPEPRGKEQGNPDLRRAKLDTAMNAVDKVLLGVSQTEYNLFMQFKRDFLALRWCNRVALKRICDGTTSSLALGLGLVADGVADPDKIVGQLIGAGFVENNLGALRPKEPRWLDALLHDNPPC